MQELQLLKHKLDLLIKKYSALQAENIRLKETIDQYLKSIDGLNKQMSKMEQGMATQQIGNVAMGVMEKESVRKQLDTVIGEIDKILTTLND
ncbi:MAG: hypothetical protein WCG87_05135 [Bacteroidota bacterium]